MINKPISEVIEEAKLSATVLEYISQFEASEIEGDDVDLRFEIDGVDTGCDVSITDQCGKAAGSIKRLIDHIEDLEQQLAAERARVVKVPRKVYVRGCHANMVGWSKLIDALESAGVKWVDADIQVEGE
ncbi:hypothetical protein [Pectobacterium brasiliense]|uniref:hypothetical protein n=1 Tax=Pectobacterium brasiliense TaxID=180957 RepID=UPI000CE695D3|nr:hypothetical protein [Pectobacterium brasiliense]PPE64195.1 hypothetical protein F152LOC_00985 [Pectobacterium brasiliense]